MRRRARLAAAGSFARGRSSVDAERASASSRFWGAVRFEMSAALGGVGGFLLLVKVGDGALLRVSFARSVLYLSSLSQLRRTTSNE